MLLLISRCVCCGLNASCPRRGLTQSGRICVYCPKLTDAGEKEREEGGREAGSEAEKAGGVKKSKEMRETKRVQEEQRSLSTNMQPVRCR